MRADVFKLVSATTDGPTHRVSVPYALVYQEPSFKRPDSSGKSLPLNSRVRIIDSKETSEGVMARVRWLGWVFADQLIPIDEFLTDPVDVALSYAGPTPYSWGGRAAPDCSGLVQQSVLACGTIVPRNCGEQARDAGKLVDHHARGFAYRRGDLVFWTEIPDKSRHVAIMVNEHKCVHASIAQSRRVVCQPFAEVWEQQEKDGNGHPNVVRRFDWYPR